MLAAPKIGSGNRARNYYEQDTYFINNEFEQGAFYGKLKEELGLGNFNLEDFDHLIAARNPRTGEQLLKLTKKDLDAGGDRKRAYADLTFAADKSVSILYEISDDKTKSALRTAFTRSIDKALDFAETNYANVKSRNSRSGKPGSGKMIFVRFNHSESRNNDMHLHEHSLAMNMTQDKDGNWRAVEYNEIMKNHQLLGQIQRNEFAQELQAMGFELEILDPKQGTFKLKNVDEELRHNFSTRSEDIKNEMNKSGQTSYQASHVAQKKTRKWKDKNKDRMAIQDANIERLKIAGADIEAIKETNPEQEIRTVNSEDAIKMAFEDIADKNSVLTREDILKHALKLTITTQGSDLKSLQEKFNGYGDLVTLDADKNQYTTQEILAKERTIFSQKNNKVFAVTDSQKQIEIAIKAFEREKAFSLKQGQNELAKTVLSSNKQFILAQGVAGAGKSTSLEIVRNVCEQQSRRIIALAPTGTATDNLAKEANIQENYTVAKFIQTNGNGIHDAVLVVDEAGMMGMRDTYELMDIAIKNNCKVIFSGDKNQKKSIAAGDIFSGMQRQEFLTVNLDEGNRQKNEMMKKAVKQIKDRDITGALETLKNTTREITNSDERLQAAHDEYLKDRNNTLLITTTNSDRRRLNAMIRESLIEAGEVTNINEFPTRETPSLHETQKRSALHYKKGQTLYLGVRVGRISAGREAIITEVDRDANIVTIEHISPTGKKLVEAVDLTRNGVYLNQYIDTSTSFGIGDQVITKKNDKKMGVKNGWIGTITAIDRDALTIKFDKKEIKLPIKNYPYIQHAYAITDFASQGKTTDKVLAVANSMTASFNDFYTQITRAKFEAHIITDDIEKLRERAAKDSVKLNAWEIFNNKGLNDENKNITGFNYGTLRESTDKKFERYRKTASPNDLRTLSDIGLANVIDRAKSILSASTRLVMDKIGRAKSADKLRRSRASDHAASSQKQRRGGKIMEDQNKDYVLHRVLDEGGTLAWMIMFTEIVKEAIQIKFDKKADAATTDQKIKTAFEQAAEKLHKNRESVSEAVEQAHKIWRESEKRLDSINDEKNLSKYIKSFAKSAAGKILDAGIDIAFPELAPMKNVIKETWNKIYSAEEKLEKEQQPQQHNETAEKQNDISPEMAKKAAEMAQRWEQKDAGASRSK